MAKQTETPKPPKVRRINRSAVANLVVGELAGKSTLSELAEKADALFVEHGGKSKVRAAAEHVRRALETGETLGVLKLTRPTDILVERVKGK
jgi:hypothetical protein